MTVGEVLLQKTMHAVLHFSLKVPHTPPITGELCPTIPHSDTPKTYPSNSAPKKACYASEARSFLRLEQGCYANLFV